MFALGIIDKITPDNLTGGRFIAGTGEIEADGTVDPIGGIQQKMAGARAAGRDDLPDPGGELPGHRGGGARRDAPDQGKLPGRRHRRPRRAEGGQAGSFVLKSGARPQHRNGCGNLAYYR